MPKTSVSAATALEAALDLRQSWPDEKLVHECLKGAEDAWTALIQRYKNLIFSIPVKHGFSREDAADIFQSVCAELVSELPKLREPKALPAWLIRVTLHKCQKDDRQRKRFVQQDGEWPETGQDPMLRPDGILRQLEQEQALRDSLRSLTPRCQQLITELFFREPPRPYQEVAESLKLSVGSIGFIRGRCLDKLRGLLTKTGF
jgi:RNA polymerase sigma factor (sigma-70 family)